MSSVNARADHSPEIDDTDTGDDEVDGARMADDEAGREPSRGERTGGLGAALARPFGKQNLLVTGATALLVVCALVAVWFGVLWFSASHDDDLAFAQERDEVARVGGATIVTLESVDYTRIDQWFNESVNVLVGDEQANFIANKDARKQQLVAAKVITQAKVQAASVVELNSHDGTASVMVVVSLTKQGGKPQDAQLQRFVLSMTRTDTGWKTTTLDPVQPLAIGQ